MNKGNKPILKGFTTKITKYEPDNFNRKSNKGYYKGCYYADA